MHQELFCFGDVGSERLRSGTVRLPELLVDVDASLTLALPLLTKMSAKNFGRASAWVTNPEWLSLMFLKALMLGFCPADAFSLSTPSQDQIVGS